MKLSEAANKVIDLSRKVFDYYEAEYPKYYPNYPLVDSEEDVEGKKVPPPPEEKELREYLATLSEEMLHQLVLLVYFGRWEFGPERLAENYEKVKDRVGDAVQTASWMMHEVPLADELLDGLEELRKHHLNIDKLPLQKVKARKR